MDRPRRHARTRLQPVAARTGAAVELHANTKVARCNGFDTVSVGLNGSNEEYGHVDYLYPGLKESDR